MAYGNSLSGNQSLAYVGTSANQPPNWTFETRDPNQYDINSRIGDLWMNKLLPNNGPWVLVSLQGDANSKGPLATWVPWGGGIRSETGNSGGPVYGDANRNINVVGDGTTVNVVGDPATNTLTISANGSGIVEELEGNTGGPVMPSAGVIHVVGDTTGITIAGDPATHTLTASLVGGGIAAQSFVTDSGTATPTTAGVLDVFGDGHNITVTAPSAHEVEVALTGITQHSLQVGGATNSLTQLGVATDGQIPIGYSGGHDPVLANITAGANITITNGPGSIEISATGGTFPSSANSFLAYTNNLTAPFTNGFNTVPYANTLFNNGSVYNTGTYTFTAPVSGYYNLTACLNLGAVNYTPSTVTVYAMQFVTTTDVYLVTNASPYADAAYISNGPVYGFNITGSTVCYMTAGDTAYVEIDIANSNEVGNPTIDVTGFDTSHGRTRLRSFFSGYLIEGGNGAITQLHTDDGHNVTATAGVINIAGDGVAFTNPSSGAGGLIQTVGTVGPNTVTIQSNYSTGTWNPTVSFGGSSTGIAYTVQSGLYTKIGNMIFITCHVEWTSTGAATGAFRLNGLPFTTHAAPAVNTMAVQVSYVNLSPGYTWVGGGTVNSVNYIYLVQQGSGVIALALSDTNFNTGASNNVVLVGGVYLSNL